MFLGYAEIFAQKIPEIYHLQYQKFFCYNLERVQCKEKKLAILPLVTMEYNAQAILDELYSYIDLPSVETAKAAIRAIGKICVKLDVLKGNV